MQISVAAYYNIKFLSNGIWSDFMARSMYTVTFITFIFLSSYTPIKNNATY